MVALLREFPDVKLTFTLVPSLLVQLEAFAANQARDRTLALSLKPAAQLTDEDKRFILAHFFHAQRARMIEPYPRYAELLRRAEQAGGNGGAAKALSEADFRDLQVWHKLAWVDPFWMDSDRARQGAAGAGPRLQRRRQAGPARGRARDPRSRHARVRRRGRARPDRDRRVAVLPPDPAAGVRHRHLPADASPFADAAAAVPAPGGRARRNSSAPRCTTSSASAGGPWGCGRRKARCPTRLSRWPRRPGSRGWRPTRPSSPARLNTGLTRDGYGHLEQPEVLYRPYTHPRPAAGKSRACSATTCSRT